MVGDYVCLVNCALKLELQWTGGIRCRVSCVIQRLENLDDHQELLSPQTLQTLRNVLYRIYGINVSKYLAKKKKKKKKEKTCQNATQE